MKGSVKTGDLTNLQEEMAENMGKKMEKLEESMETNMGNMEKKMEMNMGNMEKKMEKLEESMDIIVNLIQHPKENFPNDDKVGPRYS